jgi:hypothetical protein
MCGAGMLPESWIFGSLHQVEYFLQNRHAVFWAEAVRVTIDLIL